MVEYKKRDESDDEYDEFGRRKKRKDSSELKLKSHRESFSERVCKKSSNDCDNDDDDDDDEDDDNEDLSKYDLWGNDEEDKTVSMERNNRTNSRSSCSRSRSKSPKYVHVFN